MEIARIRSGRRLTADESWAKLSTRAAVVSARSERRPKRRGARFPPAFAFRKSRRAGAWYEHQGARAALPARPLDSLPLRRLRDDEAEPLHPELVSHVGLILQSVEHGENRFPACEERIAGSVLAVHQHVELVDHVIPLRRLGRARPGLALALLAPQLSDSQAARSSSRRTTPAYRLRTLLEDAREPVNLAG